MSATILVRDLYGQWGSRIPPAAPVTAYKTYEILAPLKQNGELYWRPASCAEIGCLNYQHGWETILPAGSDMIETVRRSGRSYTEARTGDGLVTFTFEAGQPCFKASEHRLPLDRPRLYVVRGGDWRANVGTIRRHTRPDDWAEDFVEHQQKIAGAIERG